MPVPLASGTLVTIAASTAAADITGIVLAGVIATIGLFIVPARRRKAKEDLRQKVRDLRETLSRALRAQFQQEVAAQHRRGSTKASPPTAASCVPSSSRSPTVRDTLADVQARLADLAARIDALT